MKSKKVAALLALFFGVFGVHRFYLGQKLLGILYMILFSVSLLITIEEGAPLVVISAILGFIDFILFAVMPIEDFDEKFNRKWLYGKGRRDYHRDFEKNSGRPSAKNNDFEELKRLGIEAFRAYDFDEAICFFEEALEEQPNSPAILFNLACCFSMVEDSETAFSYLESAVRNGFDKTQKIHTHDALAYLRIQSKFEDFVSNGYRVEKPLQALPAEENDLLTQLAKLGELRDKGLLSEDEFTIQKKKLLG